MARRGVISHGHLPYEMELVLLTLSPRDQELGVPVTAVCTVLTCHLFFGSDSFFSVLSLGHLPSVLNLNYLS